MVELFPKSLYFSLLYGYENDGIYMKKPAAFFRDGVSSIKPHFEITFNNLDTFFKAKLFAV